MLRLSVTGWRMRLGRSGMSNRLCWRRICSKVIIRSFSLTSMFCYPRTNHCRSSHRLPPRYFESWRCCFVFTLRNWARKTSKFTTFAWFSPNSQRNRHIQVDIRRHRLKIRQKKSLLCSYSRRTVQMELTRDHSSQLTFKSEWD